MFRFLVQIIFLFSALVVFAQESSGNSKSTMRMASLNTSGGNATSSEGSVAYSIGEINYTHMESSNNGVFQGVQQPVEFGKKLDTNNTVARILAYPNPTTDYIILDIVDFEKDPTRYQIYGSNGSIIETGEITTKTTKLITENWSNAIYFVSVSVLNKYEENLKIIKQ